MINIDELVLEQQEIIETLLSRQRKLLLEIMQFRALDEEEQKMLLEVSQAKYEERRSRHNKERELEEKYN